MDKFIIPVLKCNRVLIIPQMFRLQRINSFISPQIVQLMLIFDSNLFLSGLFFLIITGPGQPLQSTLFFDPSIVDIPIFTPPRQIEHSNGIYKHSFFNLIVQGRIRHETRRLVNFDQPWLCFFVKKDIYS